MGQSTILLIVGLALTALGPVIFMRPRWFLRGRKVRFWVSVIGEGATLKMIQFLSAPLALFGGLFLVLKSLGLLSG